MPAKATGVGGKADAHGRGRLMRIGVLGNPGYQGLDAVLERLTRAAADRGFELYPGGGLADRLAAAAGRMEEAWDELDCVLTLGGDGTLLRGARMAAPRGVPVLGCNLGRLGFLTMVPLDGLEDAMTRLAEGEFEEERRLALEVRVEPRPAAEVADDPGSFYSVNDAVIHKSGLARLITLRVWADDEEVGQYSADGIILSTSTGSTAYSLSAGGPILVPSLDALVATPISPHTLAVRPVVLPGDTRITVELVSSGDDIVLTLDGQAGSDLGPGDRIHAERSPHPLRLLTLPGHSFFSVLRRKLRWGDVRPRDR